MERKQTVTEVPEELGWTKEWENRGIAIGEARGRQAERTLWQNERAELLKEIQMLKSERDRLI